MRTARHGNPGERGKRASRACRLSFWCACRQASAYPAAWVSAARVFTASFRSPPDKPRDKEVQAHVRRARELLRCMLVGRLELALTRQAAALAQAAQVGLSAPLRRGTPGLILTGSRHHKVNRMYDPQSSDTRVATPRQGLPSLL